MDKIDWTKDEVTMRESERNGLYYLRKPGFMIWAGSRESLYIRAGMNGCKPKQAVTPLTECPHCMYVFNPCATGQAPSEPSPPKSPAPSTAAQPYGTVFASYEDQEEAFERAKADEPSIAALMGEGMIGDIRARLETAEAMVLSLHREVEELKDQVSSLTASQDDL